jgi:hypothetical protein
VLCNVATNCYDFLASVIDEGISMEYWWNNNDSGKPEYSEKIVPVPFCPPHIPHGMA